MKHRQSERSTQSLKPGDGVPGAMMVRGLKDTSSRPAKDLGGTLRHTRKTVLRSYDSSARSGLLCPRRQGCVANVTKMQMMIIRGLYLLSVSSNNSYCGYSSLFKVRYHALADQLPAHSCDFENYRHILDRKGEYLWKN